MIQYLVKPHRQGKRSTPNYRGRYRLDGDEKITDISLRTTDKRVAEKRLAAIVEQAQRERAGLTPPQAMTETAARSIADLADEFCDELKARGRAAKYYKPVRWRIIKLADSCGWNTLRDITSETFCTWRASQDNMSASTLNHYLDAIRSMLRWLHQAGRVPHNPLESVTSVRTEGRETRIRRALSDDQVRALLEHAGPRRAVYLTALLTGLRRSELNSLRWRDVHLDAVRPFIEVHARHTKNHKRAIVWLRDDLVAELRSLVGPDEDRVFAGGVPEVDELRRDLDEAGIEFEDADGRRCDFHALRHTLATSLQRAGVPMRLAMEVMRHSDVRLTAKTYTDVAALPVHDAIEQLPRWADDQAEMRSQRLVAGGPELSHAVAAVATCESQNTQEIPAQSRNLSPGDTHGQAMRKTGVDGNRTHLEPATQTPQRV